jgi:HAD superfamily hydrolase (TIGR01484 family)
MSYDRLVVLDVDGVLTEFGKPIANDTINLLREISKYAEISFASGKPRKYLKDIILKKIKLPNTIQIGENGGDIYIPIKKKRIIFKNKRGLKHLRKHIDNCLRGKIVYQRKIINITVFPNPKRPTKLKEIEEKSREIIDRNKFYGKFKIYVHPDCIDIVPIDLDKSWAIDRISKELGIPVNKFIAVGDGFNDIEMLNKVKNNKGVSISVGIKSEVINAAVEKFETGLEALNYILSYLRDVSEDPLDSKTKNFS